MQTLTWLFLSIFLQLSDSTEQLLHEQTVKIEVYERNGGVSYGSGIAFCRNDQYLYLITAAHVLYGKDGKLRVRAVNISSYRDLWPAITKTRPELDPKRAAADLALIKIPIPTPAPVTAVFGESESLSALTPLFVSGYSVDDQKGWQDQATVTRSQVGEFLELSLRLSLGYSGGPVVNQYGELVGMNVSVAGKVTRAIPIEQIMRTVDNWLNEAGCIPRKPYENIPRDVADFFLKLLGEKRYRQAYNDLYSRSGKYVNADQFKASMEVLSDYLPGPARNRRFVSEKENRIVFHTDYQGRPIREMVTLAKDGTFWKAYRVEFNDLSNNTQNQSQISAVKKYMDLISKRRYREAFDDYLPQDAKMAMPFNLFEQQTDLIMNNLPFGFPSQTLVSTDIGGFLLKGSLNTMPLYTACSTIKEDDEWKVRFLVPTFPLQPMTPFFDRSGLEVAQKFLALLYNGLTWPAYKDLVAEQVKEEYDFDTFRLQVQGLLGTAFPPSQRQLARSGNGIFVFHSTYLAPSTPKLEETVRLVWEENLLKVYGFTITPIQY